MGTFAVTLKVPAYLTIEVEADSKDEAVAKAQASEANLEMTSLNFSEVYDVAQS